MPAPTLGTLAVNDLIFVTYKMRLWGQRIMNTFYYSVSAVGAVPGDRWTAYASLRTQMQLPAGLEVDLRACMTADVSLETLRLQFISPQRMAFREFVVGNNGTHPGVSGTPNVAASIERRTELASRHGVGRIQIAGMPDNAYSTGFLTVPYIAVLDTLATEIPRDITDAAGNTYRPVLAYHDPLSAPPWVASPVIGCETKNTVRVMRRRTVGLGE